MTARTTAFGFAVGTALLTAAIASAQAANWVIEPAHSQLGFTGSQSGAPFTGHFGDFAGTISFDPAKPAEAKTDIIIDVASAATGDKQKDGAMPGADWFDAKKFPQAHFVSTGFKPLGGDKFETTGTLTIRGMSKPVTLPFTLAITGDTAKAVGQVQLIRTQFGVGQGAWATAQYVALEVAVTFSILAKTAGQ
jgi:polyisoprenoid-binding protein YceI